MEIADSGMGAANNKVAPGVIFGIWRWQTRWIMVDYQSRSGDQGQMW